MSNIKVVSDRTIVKKITVGTPLAAVKKIAIETTIANVLDVNSENAQTGHLLVYDKDTEMWNAQNLLDLQVIDGGEGF